MTPDYNIHHKFALVQISWVAPVSLRLAGEEVRHG
jgi:hypothetical protein